MGDWRSFKFTCEETDGWLGANSAWAAGESWLFLVEDTVGVLIEDTDFGDEGVLIYHAEKVIVPKMTESTDIFLPGDRVYWDPATRLVTPTYDSAYYWIGIATEPAGATEETVEIDLKGDHAEVEVVLP
jgi:predicted RecA/RadA family phage recombinase